METHIIRRQVEPINLHVVAKVAFGEHALENAFDKEFEKIIVRANPDGSIVRLGDVAQVQLGSKDYEFMGRVNGKPATLVGIFLSPGANALDVAKSVKQEMAQMSARFPGLYSGPESGT